MSHTCRVRAFLYFMYNGRRDGAFDVVNLYPLQFWHRACGWDMKAKGECVGGVLYVPMEVHPFVVWLGSLPDRMKSDKRKLKQANLAMQVGADSPAEHQSLTFLGLSSIFIDFH